VSDHVREYLDAAELAARTPWSVEAIRRMVGRGVLRRGVHYFQPLGPRTQLIFKWSAIVALIEGVPAAAAPVTSPAAHADERGHPDVQAATAALQRLLS
jgi:hypothetical protein